MRTIRTHLTHDIATTTCQALPAPLLYVRVMLMSFAVRSGRGDLRHIALHKGYRLIYNAISRPDMHYYPVNFIRSITVQRVIIPSEALPNILLPVFSFRGML